MLASGRYEGLSKIGYMNDLDLANPVDNIMEASDEFTEMKRGNNENSGAFRTTRVESKGGKVRVGLGVLWSYMRAGNGVIIPSLIFFFFIANQAVLSGSDVVLQQWYGYSQNYVHSYEKF